MQRLPLSTRADEEPRIIVASNRGPVEHYYGDDGSIGVRKTGGGLAVAMRSVAQERAMTWIAAASSEADRMVACRQLPFGHGGELRLLRLPPAEQDLHYNVISNPVLWFVQHGLGAQLGSIRCERELVAAWRDGYLPVNQRFAEAVIEELDRHGGDAVVMMQDYQLYTAPRIIREARPEACLQHFVHIPWPRPDAWRLLPDEIVRDICRGLLGNDSVVFQTEEFAESFLDTCRVFLEGEAAVCARLGEVTMAGQTTRVWANPISVNVDELGDLAATAVFAAKKADLGPAHGVKTIVRVDRLDPSKNVSGGFQAFERLLESRPDLRGKVSFLTFLVPSRVGIPEYDGYAEQVLGMVDAINDRYSYDGWQPIRLYYGEDRLRALAGLALADVVLVNSLADGLNLVAKEAAIVSERDAVLVLSRAAGAYPELRSGAIGIDPADVDGTAAVLEQALLMSGPERQRRAEALRFAISGHRLDDWMRLLLNDLSLIRYVKQTAGVAGAAAPPMAGVA